ncbi:carbohydrate-binding module family 14 protein [Streptomyces globisporus]
MKIPHAAVAAAIVFVSTLSANVAHAHGVLADSAQVTTRQNLTAGTSRPTYLDVTYYDCIGRHETRETHPFDATRYIVCTNGRAHDTPCPDSDLADPAHPYQVFEPAMGACVQPNDGSTPFPQASPDH